MTHHGSASWRRLASLWLPVIVWMAIIFIGSSRPDVPVHSNGHIDFLLKKGAHVAEYAGLGFLLWRGFGGSLGRQLASPPHSAGGQPGEMSLLPFMLTLAAGSLYAVSDEAHQLFVLNRHGRLTDVALDVAAILLALMVVWLWERQLRSKSEGRRNND